MEEDVRYSEVLIVKVIYLYYGIHTRVRIGTFLPGEEILCG